MEIKNINKDGKEIELEEITLSDELNEQILRIFKRSREEEESYDTNRNTD